jgi:hypothetical protein
MLFVDVRLGSWPCQNAEAEAHAGGDLGEMAMHINFSDFDRSFPL